MYFFPCRGQVGINPCPPLPQGRGAPAATKGGSSFPVVWLALACVLTTIVVALAAAYFLGVIPRARDPPVLPPPPPPCASTPDKAFFKG